MQIKKIVFLSALALTLSACGGSSHQPSVTPNAGGENQITPNKDKQQDENQLPSPGTSTGNTSGTGGATGGGTGNTGGGSGNTTPSMTAAQTAALKLLKSIGATTTETQAAFFKDIEEVGVEALKAMATDLDNPIAPNAMPSAGQVDFSGKAVGYGDASEAETFTASVDFGSKKITDGKILAKADPSTVADPELLITFQGQYTENGKMVEDASTSTLVAGTSSTSGKFVAKFFGEQNAPKLVGYVNDGEPDSQWGAVFGGKVKVKTPAEKFLEVMGFENEEGMNAIVEKFTGGQQGVVQGILAKFKKDDQYLGLAQSLPTGTAVEYRGAAVGYNAGGCYDCTEIKEVVATIDFSSRMVTKGSLKVADSGPIPGRPIIQFENASFNEKGILENQEVESTMDWTKGILNGAFFGPNAAKLGGHIEANDGKWGAVFEADRQ